MAAVALITGASAGLGVEFARQLSKKGRGWSLPLGARTASMLSRPSWATPAQSRSICRTRSSRDADARPDVAGDQVETLVNNAGFGLRGRFAELDPARQREMIDLNCGTLTELCRAIAPQMVERRSGAILNVASTAAFQPGPNMAVYFATKAYVLSFTEALHEEMKPHGVKVSALCPGPTRTEFGDVAGIKSLGQFDRLAMEAEPVVRAGLDGLKATRPS